MTPENKENMSTPEMPEDELLRALLDKYVVSPKNRASIDAYLELLGKRSEETRRHSIRVADLASRVGEAAGIPGIEPKVLMWAGFLHDVGKALVDPQLLKAGVKFDDAAFKEMEHHVGFGMQLLHGVHEWTAHIVVRHHHFGKHPYPTELPPLPPHLKAKEGLINTYARLLALADYYDALMTRENDKFGRKLTPQEKREQYFSDNRDQEELIGKLEAVGVFRFAD